MANFIHPTAIIGDNVIIGDGNYIGAYCIIGDPAEHKKFWQKEKGKVYIGDNNIITGLVTIDAGTEIDTYIGNNCFIMKHVYIAHDSTIFDNVTICSGAKIGGHCIIDQGSNIGLNAALHQFTHIGENCMIGASAFVKGEAKANTKYAGVPAREIGSNIR